MTTPIKIFISSLNTTSKLDKKVEIIGSLIPAPELPTTSISGTISLADCYDMFKIRSTGINGNPASTKNFENWEALPMTEIGTSMGGFLLPSDSNMTTSVNEVLAQLSDAVFGSSNAVSFFSNLPEMKVSILDSFDRAVHLANNNKVLDLETNLANDKTDIQKKNITETLADALFYLYLERFLLKYNASPPNNHGPKYASRYKKVQALGSESGAVCYLDVTMYRINSGGTFTDGIRRIKIVGNKSGTFVENENLSISDPDGLTNFKFDYSNITSSDVTDLNKTIEEVAQEPSYSNTLDISKPTNLIYSYGEFTNVMAVSGNNSNINAICTIKLEPLNSNIDSIVVTTPATQGLRFSHGDVVIMNVTYTIVEEGVEMPCSISINGLNPVGAALLNHNTDAAEGISLPIMRNDIIKFMITLYSHPDQYIAGTTNPASMEFECYGDFTVSS